MPGTQISPVSLVVRIPVFHAARRTPATRVRTPDGRFFLQINTSCCRRWRAQGQSCAAHEATTEIWHLIRPCPSVCSQPHEFRIKAPAERHALIPDAHRLRHPHCSFCSAPCHFCLASCFLNCVVQGSSLFVPRLNCVFCAVQSRPGCPTRATLHFLPARSTS